MGEDLSYKTVCVYDYGLFVSWALKLTEYFGRVLYFCSWQSGFPSSRQFMIGQGLEGVERVENFWDIVGEVDLFVFPDVFCGDLQQYLRNQGRLVWGCGHGEDLELRRWECKQLLKDLDLPVQPVHRLIGIDALREYLMEHEDKYIKISLLRGDFETWHHINYELSEPRLDEIETKIGANKFDKEFIVEDAINNASEIGYDGYTIEGKFPDTAMQGYEIKDVALIGSVRPYEKLPEQLKEVNAKLAPVLSDYGYRGFWSTEVRIPHDKEHRPYFTDACCRAGSPPSELYQELITNWGEIMWVGAQGGVVDMKPAARYGVEALIHSSWADLHWQAVHFPPELVKWVKLRNMCRIGDVYHVAPQNVGLPEIGAVVAIGDSIVSAIRKLAKYCEQVSGYDVELMLSRIPDAVDAIQEGNSIGIRFSDDPLPSKAQIADAIKCQSKGGD